MPIEITKKPNESIASLMRRFSRQVQRSGLINTAKAKRARKRPTTQRMQKNRALMRVHLQSLRRRLERQGKYDEETFEKEKRDIKQKLDI